MSGGRRATQPTPGWTPPQRLLPDGVSVRFVAEDGVREKVFDFSGLPVPAAVQGWLAVCLARRVGARSAVKHVTTAQTLAWTARRLARALAEHPVPVRSPGDITVDHILGFRRRHEHLDSLGFYVASLRSLLHDDTELSEDARAALASIRVPKRTGEARETQYTQAEWQLILTAARRDVRLARERVGAGRELLARFRRGDLAPGGPEHGLARLLDAFDRTGDVPRGADGLPGGEVRRVGGLALVASSLCLSLHELTAFALLLVALTGHNFGTVSSLPAAHFRPDGTLSEQGLALVEAVKPRRGPEHEHMVIPLEDVLSGGDGEPRLLRSPLRVYRLLLDLGETARRHGHLVGLFAGYTPWPGRHGTRWPAGPQAHHVTRWARAHGFPESQSAAQASGRPMVSVRRLRRTVIERRRRPVAHTERTMRESYLMTSRSVQEDSREVVAAALEAEVGKARARQRIPVFTTGFVELARTDPAAAARAVGLDPAQVKGLLDGGGDTVLTACLDHTAGPHAPAGDPCPASFLTCLGCQNARALPHHLPAQLAAADQITAARPNTDPQWWATRLQPRLRQLQDIADAFGPDEVRRARAAVTDRHRDLVTDLLAGRWDLR
jgi:hypothetical protein